MSSSTAIGWTQATWNPWMGCDKVSPGCARCYAEREHARYALPPFNIVRRSKTTTAAAATLGLSRPTLSVKISQDDFRESEIEALAELTGTTPAYLRYGISGDFEDGAREATAWMRRALGTVIRATEPEEMQRYLARVGVTRIMLRNRWRAWANAHVAKAGLLVLALALAVGVVVYLLLSAACRAGSSLCQW